MTTQILGDGRQVRGAIAVLAGQGQDAGLGRQQAGAVQLVERREQLAQRQVAEAPEQGQGAGFDSLRGHDICSSLKHELMNTPEETTYQAKCSNKTTFSKFPDSYGSTLTRSVR
ncbi:hypothetical protein D3C75_1083580 [compost metagenome]